MTQVRRARDADVEPVVSTVAAAFARDPAWSFIIGPAGRGAREAFARTLLVPRIGRGTVWVAGDGAAVAMWDRRGDSAGDSAGDPAGAWAGFRAEAGEDVWRRLTVYDDAVEAAAPARPYWYLGVLATRPEAQGTGLATAVLRSGFDAAADDGWDCWLETSTVGNKAFYAGRGFRDEVPVDVPGGPATWWLRRPAQRSG